ncbi:MAG: hypothetical protein ACP5N0_00680 [Methanosarcina sp.]|jgi:hypothetical protein
MIQKIKVLSQTPAGKPTEKAREAKEETIDKGQIQVKSFKNYRHHF